MPPKAILFSCSHQTLVSHSYSFPSEMILCYLLCSFRSSFCLAFIKFRQAESCAQGYPSHPYTHTHTLCSGYSRKCPNRWPKLLFLLWAGKISESFRLSELLASLPKWGIWDFYLLVHGLCVFRVCDCPFIIPKEEASSPKGPLYLSFYSDRRSFQISLNLKSVFL